MSEGKNKTWTIFMTAIGFKYKKNKNEWRTKSVHEQMLKAIFCIRTTIRKMLQSRNIRWKGIKYYKSYLLVWIKDTKHERNHVSYWLRIQAQQLKINEEQKQINYQMIKPISGIRMTINKM